MVVQLSQCDDFPEEFDYDLENTTVFGLLLKTLDRLITDSTHINEILANEQVVIHKLLRQKKYFFLHVKMGTTALGYL